MSTRDEPVPLRDALAAVGRDLGIPPPNALAAITNAWPELVGPTLAPHSRVRSVRRGECVVEVDGPAWATQLRYVTDELARRMNEACEQPVVTAIRVVVARP
jgi:predicted nucleic acid-binding Zn ribbon protein